MPSARGNLKCTPRQAVRRGAPAGRPLGLQPVTPGWHIVCSKTRYLRIRITSDWAASISGSPRRRAMPGPGAGIGSPVGGAMSTEELAARDAMEFDVVIVGAGPAGLAAAIRLKQLSPDTQRGRGRKGLRGRRPYPLGRRDRSRSVSTGSFRTGETRIRRSRRRSAMIASIGFRPRARCVCRT